MIFNMIFNMPQRPTSLAAPLSRGIKHVSPVVLEPATYQPIKKKETGLRNSQSENSTSIWVKFNLATNENKAYPEMVRLR